MRFLHLGRVPGLKSIYLCIFLCLSLILMILIIFITLLILIVIILIILGWSLRNRPKCRDLGEISAFGTGSRLEINIFVLALLILLLMILTLIILFFGINNIHNIHNIGLELHDPSQMQRSL